MKKIQFTKHKNFYLNPNGWGEAETIDIITLFDSIITDFYSLFESSKIPLKEVNILNAYFKNPPTDYPEIIKLPDLNLIILSTTDRRWSQYSYQFSHELCHHVIDCNFYSTNDKFGWFEEVICELASIFSIKEMSEKWKENPPYPNWSGYSKSLEDYVQNILSKEENNIDKDFMIWFTENLELLFQDRYRRKENRIIAIELLTLFETNPELWKAIQYLKCIEVTDKMSFNQFIIGWSNCVPENLKLLVLELQNKFIT